MDEEQAAMEALTGAVEALAALGWAGKDIRTAFGDALDKAFS